MEPTRRDAPKIGRNDPCGCGSGKKPAGVDVQPLDPAATDSKKPAAIPPLKGEDAGKRLDELLKASQSSSSAIPKEIEELLRMIPC